MYAPPLPALTVKGSTLAGVLVALAMGTSTIVFSEPAVADALMALVIVAVPVVGANRLGLNAHAHLVLWLFIVGLGLAGAGLSTNMDTAVKHQLVTLFLVLGAFVLASYIAADAEARFHMVMKFYVLGCLIAACAALAGYFHILPGTYDLFTNHGRARGTFKDPNVLGAAVVPAIVYCVWRLLRAPPSRAVLAGTIAMVLSLALFITFSRGAWLSATISVASCGWLLLVTARFESELRRMLLMLALAAVSTVSILIGMLQIESVRTLFFERASLDQSYDSGPEGRFGGQIKAVQLILDNPFGIGTHTFRDTYHPEEAHNVYLSTFMNAGWIGGLLYIVSVFATLLTGLRRSLEASRLQGPFIIAAASFMGLVIEGLVIDTDHWRHFFLVMALIWGLADSASQGRPAFRERMA